MPELVAALITAAVGVASSGLLASVERIIARRDGAPLKEPSSGLRIGPFTWAWIGAIVVGIVAGIIVFASDVPTKAQIAEGAYDDFFATSAQITAALIIALAIEAGSNLGSATKYRLEACLSVALAALAAITGLVPGLPHMVYAIALTLVPPGLVGGLLGVVAVAMSRRKEISQPPPAPPAAPTAVGLPGDPDIAAHPAT